MALVGASTVALLLGAPPASAQAPEPAPQDRQTTGQGAAGAQGALSAEQRAQIFAIVARHGTRPETEIKFAVAVGAQVPITTHLYPLPAQIVHLRPEWRDHHYLVADRKLVIVDPLQLRVRAVIEQ
jgi:hypothetical protein